MNIHILRIILLGAFLAGTLASQARAATLNIDAGGNLLGASNVDVGGSLYDVEFVDGFCATLFNGCDDLADFEFTTNADAILASTALLRQVFVDIVIGPLFDSDPSLTVGCATTVCDTITPWGFSGTAFFSYTIARNDDDEVSDGIIPSGFTGPLTDFSTFSTANFARWSPVNPIPIPAAVWLFGTALIGLVGFTRRRKAT